MFAPHALWLLVDEQDLLVLMLSFDLVFSPLRSLGADGPWQRWPSPVCCAKARIYVAVGD